MNLGYEGLRGVPIRVGGIRAIARSPDARRAPVSGAAPTESAPLP
jgi:hypothetical protein